MSHTKKILIVGANSQDSIVLSNKLSREKNTIYATTRDTNRYGCRYSIIFPENKIIYTKKYSKDFFIDLFKSIKFDQIYIFSSISAVQDKRYTEEDYIESTFGLVKNLSEAYKFSYREDNCIIFNSSSVEMFGKNLSGKQNENTNLNPESPYAIGKTLAHSLLSNLRESGKILSVNGIMYNHESIYRGENFVTQKICKGVGEISQNRSKKIKLGNIDIYRDWSFAGDIVDAALYAMDHKLIGDYVLASGTARPLSDWLKLSFAAIGMKEWEEFIDFDVSLKRDGREYIPSADITKAQKILKLKNTIDFSELVTHMTTHHLAGNSLPNYYH
jgi:GDPmannose 4,6-dehydratase